MVETKEEHSLISCLFSGPKVSPLFMDAAYVSLSVDWIQNEELCVCQSVVWFESVVLLNYCESFLKEEPVVVSKYCQLRWSNDNPNKYSSF